MSVRTEELKDSAPAAQPAAQPASAPPRRHTDWSLLLGKAGVWLMLVAFGGIIWAINGGFSVLGLGVVASSFNDAGRLFWAFATSWSCTGQCARAAHRPAGVAVGRRGCGHVRADRRDLAQARA